MLLHPRMRVAATLAALCAMAVSGAPAAGQSAPAPLDASAQQWVTETLDAMSVDEQIGQLITPSFLSTYLSSDTETFEALVALTREQHVGGFLVFGGRELAPDVLLNPTYGTVTLGEPLAAAWLINRLQAAARVPLMISGDFEAGVGFRIGGGTVFPRAMAFGAAGDAQLAYEAGRVTAVESRAIGVHVNFAPVVDVNNNARNPVINTRSFGEDPALVGRLGGAYVRGVRDGGMLATVKHFPGHGDTDVDSHVGLPVIPYDRERLQAIEWPPFRDGLAAGADGVMTAHIVLPAIEPADGIPSTLSAAVVNGVIRQEFGFEGLVFTDSMQMGAVADRWSAGEAAVRAIAAGNDVVLHPADAVAAFEGVRAAVADGVLSPERIRESATRVLEAKARLGLHESRLVDLDALPARVGGRAHAEIADRASERAMTLVADARGDVPLRLPPDADILYLSVLDRPSGWRIAAPSRTFIAELRERWPSVTSVELSNQTSRQAIDLVGSTADRFDAVIASIFVRTTPRDGGMELAPPIVSLLRRLGRVTAARGQPYVAVLFGSPYTALSLDGVPAMLLTYDFYDRAERNAVRALAGEADIGGRLPVSLPGMFPFGHGLDRTRRTQ
ncbi:MAG: glycoside hydrolase family 3 protein [Vicinamibacterales bacterium]|nr:glycoside hydrolase family 3 protein [Vicinamibacterales bacterium]